MTTIDFSPLYRSTVGFDRLASLLDSATQLNTQNNNGYPPYNIEKLSESQYSITLAVAGFEESDLDIGTERGVLSVVGKKQASDEQREFLHQGIATRNFERKFQLADHVEVTNASLANGLLTIELVKEIPEALKPRKISINGNAAESKPKLAKAS